MNSSIARLNLVSSHSTLNDAQIALAMKSLEDYLNYNVKNENGSTATEENAHVDMQRKQLIDESLAPLVSKFLSRSISLVDFKSEIDSANKKSKLWGFQGIKGQMFFNLLFNACVDVDELTAELIAAIALPETEELAKSRIKTFSSYVRRVGETFVENGGSKYSRPNLSSIPFFLSYFWQIQNADLWPVFFTNSVRVLSDLNLYQLNDDLAVAYITFKHLHQEFQVMFQSKKGYAFSFYDVEHVWWFVGNKDVATTQVSTATLVGEQNPVQIVQQEANLRLPDSYIPPVIAIIPRLALNDSALEIAAQASGTSIPRALEKAINIAFTILGYETHLLGQGQGRVPDGLAIAHDHSYAIMWDAKARKNGYSMGTDDRAIREYITSQSRILKRKYHLRNLYYVVISSGFQDDYDELIRGLKMDTDINEVCLMESDVLLTMTDVKLRDPSQVTLGPDGLQRIFCKSGVIKASDVAQDQS
jgi:hypothetical protein